MIIGYEFVFHVLTGIIRLVFQQFRSVGNFSCAKITSCLTLCLLICFETVLLCTLSDCTKSFYIHWNTSNPIFHNDNQDHIITVNQGNSKFDYDQLNIICPVYTPGSPDEDTEKYIIYNVSKEEYQSCRITNPDPRIIAFCDKPNKLMYYTITFRPYSPQPGGLEFPPGHDYYFISTSSKDDLHRRVGGRCASHHMKVIFKVCRPDQRQSHLDNDLIYYHPSGSSNKTEEMTQSTARTTTTTARSISTVASSYNRPTIRTKSPENTVNVYRSNSSSRDWPLSKSNKKHPPGYVQHPNEVVTNEELTNRNGNDNFSTFALTRHKLLTLVIAINYLFYSLTCTVM